MASWNDQGANSPQSPVSKGEVTPPEPIVPGDEELVYEEDVDLEGRPELSVVIVEAVAEIRDVPVTRLIETLNEAIDPDGLRNTFRSHPSSASRSGWVTFFYYGCRIVLTSDHELRIYDRQAALERSS